MTRCPRPFDRGQGQETVALFPSLPQEMKDLIEGVAGCSPYLKSLLESEQEWVPEALSDPEASFLGIEQLIKTCDTDSDNLGTDLRRSKKRTALLVALADLAGVWSLEDVTERLSRFADLTLNAALQTALALEIRRSRLPGMTETDLETGAGMVVFAMGKMGAMELNYSSDIDLICLFDETRFDAGDYDDARAAFVRATRKMSSLLNDRTSDGYVFRTDLRLRPDPAVTPVCMAMARAEAYYEGLGRTWERAAYIKARPAAGDITAGARFLEVLRPFVWRKHLDFAAIEDAHNMRLKIKAHKKMGNRLALLGHDMKLGRGGIREIEFFTQTRQLISGGRDPDLRVRGTIEGLQCLSRKGWVPEETSDLLTQHYRSHRNVEHRLQMLRDAQTHTLPTSPEEFERLAAFMGDDKASLEKQLLERLEEVHAEIEGFFKPETTESRAEETIDLDPDIIARWPSYPALRSSRAVEIFNRLRPDILMRLGKSVEPNEALRAFDGFLSGLPAGVQLFSLFEANPQLIDLLVDIAGTSPKLASFLSRNASVFDAVIAGEFFSPWPGWVALKADLESVLVSELDYESKLGAARRWCKEWHFRIGVHHLRGLVDADQAGEQYSDLATAAIAALWPEVVDQFSSKHGPPPGLGAVVLGMGSLGAGKLNAVSDLDLIVIYDAAGVEASAGARPLASRVYYARLTQALITALTAPMADGKLYEVDMRLRPSGNQGPVATGLSAFKSYQREQAWVWEHLALTRARVVAGPDELSLDVETFREQLLTQKSDPASVLDGVIDMRKRVAEAKSSEGEFDAKTGPGRMQDIELVAQACMLVAECPERDVAAGLKAGVAIGWLNAADKSALDEAYDLCWRLHQASCLLGDKALVSESLGEGARLFVFRETEMQTLDALAMRLEDVASFAARAIEEALSRVGRR